MFPIKKHFLLDPAIHFLNHGSFGACPQPVFAVYQEWQRRLERQPVLFLGRQFNELMAAARQALGAYLHTAADNLVYIPNATHGVNIVARALKFQPGDEILTTDHEYGACDYSWELNCQKSAARYVRRPIPLPVASAEDILERFWEGVNGHTRLIYLSHITSPTALRLPVEAICQRARAAGILTLVDGAHAPGQIPLNLPQIGADFYTGNCHKWMLAPKGAAFLYARPEVQALVEPLIVSWGYHTLPESSSGSPFVDILQWTGTHDPAAALSVPAAIQFMADNQWETVRPACHTQLSGILQRIGDLVQMASPYPLESDLYAQMGIAPLPGGTDVAELKTRLYADYGVEVPLIEWTGQKANGEPGMHKFVRVSVQAYNSEEDLNALYTGLAHLLPQVQR